MWVRGLKRNYANGKTKDATVAPHVGAWIETSAPAPSPSE